VGVVGTFLRVHQPQQLRGVVLFRRLGFFVRSLY
jgi:hypothetical protein